MIRILSLIAGLLAAAPAVSQEVSYLQLRDMLDRPRDGYCLDVVGAGSRFRTDIPLTVHNCKPGNAPDGQVILREDGTLFMPAFDACVTTMGVNRTVLPGAALMLAPCGGGGAFSPPPALQRYTLTSEGHLTVTGGLCVTAGPVSGPTLSPFHAWRPLYVEPCTETAAPRQRWQLIAPFGT